MSWRDPEPTAAQREYIATHRPRDSEVHPDRRDRFGWEDGDVEPIDPPQCAVCRNLTSAATWTCRAFPAGIPGAILAGAFDHTKPYLGDHGIRFTPRSEQEKPS